jgi:hypothetical protein
VPRRAGRYFFHGSALLIAPGSVVAVGAGVEFTRDHDRTGRPRAVNIRMIDRGQQAVPADRPALIVNKEGFNPIRA